jgi:4-hydroxy-tetrahydrodipicolinate synthase
MLYDIPVRSGRRIAASTMLRLAREVPAIVALKDAAGDPAGTAHLAARVPAGFEIYSGDDVMTLPLLAVGAVG